MTKKIHLLTNVALSLSKEIFAKQYFCCLNILQNMRAITAIKLSRTESGYFYRQSAKIQKAMVDLTKESFYL